VPSEPELELARDLALNIGVQADGTKEHERLWISAAASLIEQLLSGSATEAQCARARRHLQLVH
jgi:hypothetical protein